MKIEIFADDLDRSDVKYNQHFFGIRMILVRNDEILMEYSEAAKTYTFPGIAYFREAERQLAFSSLAKALNVEPLHCQNTVTILEHFPKRTYIHHYYRAEVAKTVQLEPVTFGGKIRSWILITEALTLLEEYRGNDAHGAQKMEREFIALFNSI